MAEDDACPITITNHDIQINELLRFVSCKSRVMSNPHISKLCCDFYTNTAIQEAKDVLLGNISLPESDKRKSRRKTKIAATNMQDIITIFYEMKPREMPVFVAENLNNLPPLSMNNFDMSHIIEEMAVIKCKMALLQEAQEKSLAVHIAMCNDPDRAQPTAGTPTAGAQSATNPEVRTGPQLEDAGPQPEVTDTTPRSPTVVFNITGGSVEHGMDGNDEDLLHLARIQNEMPPAERPPRPSTPINVLPPRQPQSLNDSIMSNTSYASLVRNGQLNQQSVQGGYGGHHQRNRRLNKRNTAFGNDNHRRDNDVITGSGRNFDISASDHRRRRFPPKHREVIGVFVSRLQKTTRGTDVERHVTRVFGLRLKCEPVPTKYDTYTSYRIRASTGETKTLLNSNKWPSNVLVKKYYKVIY